ncbi:MAG TPA: HAMP domain-containing sensor histidine kinase [Acidimicrobiales bacterium]|nr:HAMP domain-containing sensor histidine kinase [Acidimicrobiales bacterium]
MAEARQPVWRRLGIGARITAVFGLGAFLLSFSMGGLSYFTTRHFLVAERESAAQHQAFANATLIRSSLGSGNTQYAALLASLDAGSNSRSVLVHNTTPYSSSLSLSITSIPDRLRADVLKGSAATQTYRSGTQGQIQIVVGIPIPSVKAAYFEVFSLSDLDHTLRVLGLTLIGAGVFTTLLGTALGRFASDRSLRPLAGVSRAAVSIAGGQLDTRLDADPADPDLEGLTTSFNAMVDQLQERIEREARFNSDVSHELRSPLTTLSASLEVLETDRDHLPPRSQRALQLLGADLRRFQRMVGDLLEMSRADAGPVDVFLEEVNVAELIQRAVDAGVRSLGEGAAMPKVVIEPAVRPIHVGVDKRRFERVMANLVENAAHYGGGATTVSVRVVPSATTLIEGPHDDVEIAVDDAGPGIDPMEREKVFERFYRGSASGRRGTGTGAGLGLALVAEHMRVMHGRAWVESSPAGGARFVLALPVLANEEDDQW